MFHTQQEEKHKYISLVKKYRTVPVVVVAAVVGSDWPVHSLLSGSPHMVLSFPSPRNVARKGEMDEREDERMDGAMECWTDRGYWVGGAQ